ncbi:hypothetical protein, partial [Cupriavidus campinensis]|uniref:hypothetical protein n=1 Tax=Cupriavidus campinensis TaxID=151783 RepID=UPI00361D0681
MDVKIWQMVRIYPAPAGSVLQAFVLQTVLTFFLLLALFLAFLISFLSGPGKLSLGRRPLLTVRLLTEHHR